MEDSLTLEELMELFDITQERQSRMIKAIAAAFGAQVDDPKEIVASGRAIRNEGDVARLPIGIGYKQED